MTGNARKQEPPSSSIQIKKIKLKQTKKTGLRAHLWRVEPQGFGVCLCVDVGEEVT